MPAKKQALKNTKISFKEIEQKTVSELEKLLEIKKSELEVLKRNTILGDVQNVRAFRNEKRSYARIFTALNQAKKKENK